MRAVVQRVKECAVLVDGHLTGRIGPGLLVYLGVDAEDRETDLLYMADKVMHLRIFQDEQGKMNRSVRDLGGEILVVSQFTLFGDVRRGRRPSYIQAAGPEKAREHYQRFIGLLREQGFHVESGEFAASMEVSSVNQGPVTILIDSRRVF
jgi:D-tyrosyl-tRNA(Tyr) deacylase